MRFFKPIYDQLQDVSTKEFALFVIRENIPQSISYLKTALDHETNDKVRKSVIPIYNELISDHYAFYLNRVIGVEYQSIGSLIAHYTSYIFNKNSYQSHLNLDTILNHWIDRLDKNVLDSKDGLKILNEINLKITKSFVIDNNYAGYYDFTEISAQHIVSQYTLSILYLALAERLDLPIYGIPFDDKLVLCYAAEHCTHSELVFEDDVKHYIVVGEKDLVYSPFDLEMYALLLDEKVEIKNKLPRNNIEIINTWFSHLTNNQFDIKTNSILSSKFQQIEEFVTDFED